MLGEIKFVKKTSSRSECRIGTPLTATALAPGLLKHGKEMGLNHLHVSLAHAHASVLKATAKQHGFRLTRKSVSCSASSRAKGYRAPTPHHATRRATQPLRHFHIDTTGPYQTSLGGTRYVVMFVDSALHLQRPYGARVKRAATIFSVVKRFVANMGAPRTFRTDNGAVYSNSMFVDVCNGFGMCREFTALCTLQQNRPIESAISRDFKAGHAARLGFPQLYPEIRLEEIRSCIYTEGTSLWLKSLLWASEYYNRAATPVNDEWLSPHEFCCESRPRLPLLSFLQPAYHRVTRQWKTDPRARLCYFLNFGYNHGRDYYRRLDGETGRVAYSREDNWHHLETPWITPIRAAPTEQPRDIYVLMPQSVPVAAPFLSPVATAPAPAPAERIPPPPTPMSNSPAPIPPRVSRELKYEGYVEMPGRTGGETRALRDASRDYAHRHGLPLDHAAIVSMLAKGEGQSNQRDCPPTRYLQRLTGPVDRTYIGHTYTNQSARCREIASCRHMATLHAPEVQWSFTGRYLRAGSGLESSRKRDRCQVDVHVES